MLRVGLTGSIATGKSLVSRYLQELGAYNIDYDLLARDVVEPGLPAWQDIVDYFGEDILQPDRKLDRAKLGKIVFRDKAKRRKLESFIHPRVYAEANKQEKTSVESNAAAIVVHEVPLLFEVGRDKAMDKTVVVCASEENQLKRLMARDGMSKKDARSRIRSQMSVEDKKRLADYVIDNNGTMDETKRQAQDLYQKLVSLSQKK
ncbi:MAG: dephospho-CoA kinase [Chloroflexi bacterium]|nr:dephospho-CoA kinase [Chloroflexota bacterium]MBM3154592.1 dephospho-CoA kinase [Chloroflexota bacterium]MBM3172563.1 dephospho-CoA kinase [Chloroflexota bacterium]MBM4451189.1 dephospho-CoA kinase [Chloroflexota bacterium]